MEGGEEEENCKMEKDREEEEGNRLVGTIGYSTRVIKQDTSFMSENEDFSTVLARLAKRGELCTVGLVVAQCWSRSWVGRKQITIKIN